MATPTFTRDFVIQMIQKEFENRILSPTVLEQIVYDNDPSALKDHGTRSRLVIQFGSRDKKSIGAAKAVYRQVGQIILQVFGDINVGPAPLQEVFFRVDDIFRSRSMITPNPASTVVRFLTPAQNLLGISDGADRMNVTLAFWFDEFLSIASPDT